MWKRGAKVRAVKRRDVRVHGAKNVLTTWAKQLHAADAQVVAQAYRQYGLLVTVYSGAHTKLALVVLGGLLKPTQA